MSRSVFERALDIFGLGLDEEYDAAAMRSGTVTDDEEEDEGVYHLHPERQTPSTVPLVRAEPKTMEEATIVADEIKRQVPVILNLEGSSPEEARRIRDFLAGVAYGLNGYMKKMGGWVYACSPFDMPIERLALDGSKLGTARYEEDGYEDYEDEEGATF